MSVLAIHDLTLMRGQTCTARDVSLSFRPGEVCAILGPNGTGKSSLIKAIFGELTPKAGRISLGDQVLSRRSLYRWRRIIGYMPQDTGVEAALSTLDVVLLGRMDALHMHLGDDDLHAALSAMRAVGIDHLAQRDVQSLSGGQRQLALFAQVMLRDPQVLLLDEPVSALDMHHQMVLLDHVREETRKRGLITVMVLHDLSLAAQFADRITLLGEGRVVAEGAPHDVLTPEIIGPLYRVAVERLTDSLGHPVIRPMARQPLQPIGQ
ncbi:MAG: ABC transporter ATP-binding protein [Paracoccus sp. (in: a-proteobacteria)]|uniref:ABC transporter ATP-binding protein n=1 Tax=Paracoccus sp. TaxID=267 RepID=UPI0039E62DA7